MSVGASIDDFVKEAYEEDPDEINAETDRLTEEIDELIRKKSELDQTIVLLFHNSNCGAKSKNLTAKFNPSE